MKKIVNGKIYNSETATEIAQWDNGLYRNDFRWCDESLYITKKGAYFVYGAGGPLSRWSKSVGNGMTGGSGIIALTKAEALVWCEDHDVDVEDVAEHFEVEEA